MTCDEVRLGLHEAHDETDFTLPAEVRAHVASCSACGELARDLDALSHGLRSLPRHTLPADALAAVWTETSRSRSMLSRSWTRSGYMRLAAAVAVTAVSSAALYYVFAPPPVDPRAKELARASAEATLVLGYTAKALAATRDAAADRVLVLKVSPAVRGEHSPDRRRPR